MFSLFIDAQHSAFAILNISRDIFIGAALLLFFVFIFFSNHPLHSLCILPPFYIILPVCCAAPVGTLHIHFGPLTFIICCTLLLLRAGQSLPLFSLMIHDVHAVGGVPLSRTRSPHHHVDDDVDKLLSSLIIHQQQTDDAIIQLYGFDRSGIEKEK